MTNLEPALELARNRQFLMEEDVRAIARIVQRAAESNPFGMTIVDLGAGSGTTALAVLCADPTAIVTTVDHEATAIDWARLAVRNVFPQANWMGVVADAAEAATLQQTPNVAVLLHDAGHEREDVLRDLRAWLPKVVPGGFVWVHDYRKAPWQDEWYPGVREAIDQMVREWPIAFVEQAGLGWTGRKVL